MGRRDLPPLRSLPRVFLPGLETEDVPAFELPKDEVDKFRKVLRLEEGSFIAVLPNDGRVIVCEFRARQAWPVETYQPQTERHRKIILAQALPKGDRLDTILRMGTELGVFKFVLFPAERSVVRWDAEKQRDKVRRFDAIVREAAEQSYRTRLPAIEFLPSLEAVLKQWPDAAILSELETATRTLDTVTGPATVVIGPEGGWAPREVDLIGDRGITLGPLVLRTDTAGVGVLANLLLSESPGTSHSSNSL